MAIKKIKKTELSKEMKKMLEDYLILKAKMKEDEDNAKIMAEKIFADPSILPKEFLVDFGEFEKEFKLIENEPRVDITQAMIKAAGIDPEPLYPFATFAVGKIKTMMGEPSVEKIKKTKEFKEAASSKSKTYYYKG